MGAVKNYYFDQINSLPDQPEPDPITHHIETLTANLHNAARDETLFAEISQDEVDALQYVVNSYKNSGEINDRPF